MNARKSPITSNDVVAPKFSTISCTRQFALLLTTSVQFFRFISPHSIHSVWRIPDSVWKRMFSKGMMVMNEKIFNTALRILKSTVRNKYFL